MMTITTTPTTQPATTPATLEEESSSVSVLLLDGSTVDVTDVDKGVAILGDDFTVTKTMVDTNESTKL